MDVVGHETVGEVDPGEIVEVTALAEGERLVGVLIRLGGLRGEVDETVSDSEMSGYSTGVRFRWRQVLGVVCEK